MNKRRARCGGGAECVVEAWEYRGDAVWVCKAYWRHLIASKIKIKGVLIPK